MRRLLATFLAMFMCVATAHAWWVSRDARYNVAFPPIYQGPGDAVSGALAYWLTDSCYNAAYSGNVVDVQNAGATLGTRRQCSSGVVSDLVSGSACTFVTGNACSTLATTCAVACFIVNLYDQTVGSTGGGTLCGGGACTLTQTSLQTKQPTYTANAIGTSHCGTFVGSSLQNVAATGTFTLAQPFTLTMMSERTSGTSDLLAVVRNTASAAGTIRAGYANSANKADMYAGVSVPAGITASDTHFHSLNDVFDNANAQGGSGISVDGAAIGALSLGTANGFSSTSVGLGENLSTTTNFVACEAGVYPAGTIGFSALYNNQVARYGSFP